MVVHDLIWSSSLKSFSFTEKFNIWVKAWDGVNSHEVGELYIDPQDASHFRFCYLTLRLKLFYN